MDKQSAVKIIRDTFERPFEKERFVYFIRNLFNKIEEETFEYHGQYIPDAFKPYIGRYERIGKYKDGDNRIDILAVHLTRRTSIERARTMQRNFIAGYLNGKYGSDSVKDAVLAAFVSPNEEDWRFSLIKMDYKLTQTDSGKTNAKEELTHARRYSFLVGKNEPNHTAQSQLFPLLQDDINNPTLLNLEKAFNIEKVTKEFFEKYRELFLWTKDELDKIVKNDKKVSGDFEAKNVNTVDFAKKLLGQVVFLYFLQKKGWFGVERDSKWGTGSKHFLRELYKKKHCTYNNFFNDILEPLFYEALRIDRTHDDNYYSRFNCKIPFLNGGLFDPINNYDWVHTDILIPNKLFSNSTKTKEGDIGDGILDIFDRYNFTVKEDEPLEKEVAVDPELLGKLYEKFNAIRPDNFDEYVKALKLGQKGAESKFNKQYGVYYTPREIVHYMCQQSLINYLCSEFEEKTVAYEKIGETQLDMLGNIPKKGQLDLVSEHKEGTKISKEDIEILIKYGEHVNENEATVTAKGKETDTYYYKLPESIRQNAKLIDDKLANLKVCDPAVGSGAFLVGMMSEIVKTRNVLSAFIKGSNKLLKEIDKSACHSVPTLSGSESEGFETLKQVQGDGVRISQQHGGDKTIYKFKRECIEKSLYGVDIDPGAVEIAKLRLWLSLVVDEEDIKQIKPLPNLDYKIMQGNSLIEDFHGISLDIEKKEEAQRDLFGGDSELDRLIEDLHTKQNAFFGATHPDNKKRMKEEVENAIVEVFHYELKRQQADYFRRLDGIEGKASQFPKPEDQQEHYEREKAKLDKECNFNFEAVENELREMTHGNKVRPFFPWKLYFADVFRQKGGFDVVIANPPYISFGLRGVGKSDDSLRSIFPNSAEYKLSIYAIFIDKGTQLLQSQGILSYITPDSFLLGRYFSKLRIHILNTCRIIKILMFEKDFWESGVVGRPVITILKGEPNTDLRKSNTPYYSLYHSLDDFNAGIVLSFSYPQKYFVTTPHNRFRLFFDERYKKIVDHIESGSSKLSDLVTIHTGVRSKIGQKNIISKAKEGKSWYKGLISGSEIDKYIIRHEGNFINIDPRILWSGGWNPKIILNDKLLIRQTGDSLIAAFDDNKYYHLNNLHSVSPKDAQTKTLKFVLSLLNSKLLDFYYHLISLETGRTMAQTDIETIELLPIKIPSSDIQNKIVSLVDRILAITSRPEFWQQGASAPNPEMQAKVKSLEQEIDQMVYKLYDLTEEEIKIVEGSGQQ